MRQHPWWFPQNSPIPRLRSHRKVQSQYCVQSPKGSHKTPQGQKPGQLAIRTLAHVPTSSRRTQGVRKARTIPDTENEGASNLQGRENYFLSSHRLHFLPQQVFPPRLSLSLNSVLPVQSTYQSLHSLRGWAAVFCVLDLNLGSAIRF